jgi:ABC-type branched-subunit amino acid transport system ATPase component
LPRARRDCGTPSASCVRSTGAIKDIERAIRTLAAAGDMAILLVEQHYDFARDGVKRLLAV